MKVALDLDDFSILRNRMDLLTKIREHYPTFKVSLFTIPYDIEYESSMQRMYREDAKKLIHENLDWLQIIPHGLTHIPREFEKCDRWTMKMAMQGIEEAFEKDGLPYEKGFKAPYWLWNQEVIDVLDEAGWWGAIDRNQPGMLKTKRTYTYSYSIDEPFWLAEEDTLKLHGHMTRPSTNNIEDCLLNLLKLPADTEWVYVTDLLDQP